MGIFEKYVTLEITKNNLCRVIFYLSSIIMQFYGTKSLTFLKNGRFFLKHDFFQNFRYLRRQKYFLLVNFSHFKPFSPIFRRLRGQMTCHCRAYSPPLMGHPLISIPYPNHVLIEIIYQNWVLKQSRAGSNNMSFPFLIR